MIERQLDSSQTTVEAALLAIYDRQTAEERAGRYTREANSVGFNKFDAEILTSFVDRLKRGKPLTVDQLPIARRKMKKYWRQLIQVMVTEAPEPLDDTPVLVNARPTVERSREASSSFGSW
jgi:hypothetical protein